MNAVKKPDAGMYVSRLVFDGKRTTGRDDSIKTLEATSDATRKAKLRLAQDTKVAAGKDRA